MSPRARRAYQIGLGALLAALCGSCSGGSQETSVQWCLAPEPEVTIGASYSGDMVFFRIGSIAVDAGGQIVVADRGSNEVRVFRPDGSLRWRFGGTGAGPDEFEGLVWASPGPDGVVAFDGVRQRLTHIASSGEGRRSSSLAPSDSLAAPVPVAAFQDGALLVTGANPRDIATTIPDGVIRFRRTYALYGEDGTFHRTLLGDVPGTEVLRGSTGGRMLSIPAPFARRTVTAVGADAVVIGTNEGPRVVVIDRHGQGDREVEWRQLERAVEPHHVAQFIDDLVSDAPIGSDVLRRLVSEAPAPQSFPYYDVVVLDQEDRIWVRAFPLPAEKVAVWRVLSLDGTFTAVWEAPRGLEVRAVGDTRLYGLSTDTLGVESVHVYRIPEECT